MAITQEELAALLAGPKAGIERLSTISSDGQNLLVRVPREVASFLELKQGGKLRWLVNTATKEIRIDTE